MRINELTESQDDLTARGFARIAAGSKSVVYKKGKTVVKIYDDPAFDLWVNAVQDIDNPYVPQYRDHQAGRVTLEALSKAPKGLADSAIACLKVYVRSGDMPASIGKLFPDVSKFVEIGDIVKEIVRTSGCTVDDVPSNVMMRGRVLVFTDPVTFN